MSNNILATNIENMSENDNYCLRYMYMYMYTYVHCTCMSIVMD